MNLLQALTTIRNLALHSDQVGTPQGKSALKVVNKKIASLERKKAWRECDGSMPDHAKYPEHPLNKV